MTAADVEKELEQDSESSSAQEPVRPAPCPVRQPYLS
jgi:hypothetical protein